MYQWNSIDLFLSDAIQVMYTPERGRFVVASRNVEVGECLIHENAIVNLVKSKCSLSHCYTCQKDTRIRPVPCLRCAAVVFCSPECRSKAEARYVLLLVRLTTINIKIFIIFYEYQKLQLSIFLYFQPCIWLRAVIIRFISSTWQCKQWLYLSYVSCI